MRNFPEKKEALFSSALNTNIEWFLIVNNVLFYLME